MILSEVAQEISNYAQANLDIVQSIIYDTPDLNKHLRPLDKINGKYVAVHAFSNQSVVMGFRPQWDPLGSVEFKTNVLECREFKVNYPVVPSEMKGTWFSLNAYNSRRGLAQQPISDFIVNRHLLPSVERDMNIVHGKGVYNSVYNTTLLRTMDGLNKILSNGTAAGTGDMYRINLPVITSANISNVLEEFEDKLPVEVAPYITKIFMSRANKRKYLKDDRAEHGRDLDYEKSGRSVTYEDGREIIGLKCLDGYDWIFSTTDGNFLGLMDSMAKAGITDVQYENYMVKIFMEWAFGIAFHTNQLVFVSIFSGSQPDGLESQVETEKYYPSKKV